MIKFIVWGAGNRGKDVINALGKERIVAVVDKNCQLQSLTLRGIGIVSPEYFYDNYKNYPIIVTPERYENDIVYELKKRGVYWYFLYKDEFAQTETFMLQVSIDELIKNYSMKECQYIYGFSLIGLLLVEYLHCKGYDCRLILQSSKREDLREYVERVLHISTGDFSYCKQRNLHLSVPLEINDTEKVCCEYDSYYNLVEKDIFSNPNIEKFKNIHKGKRCFIVGTGPSLRIEDLDRLKEYHEICISMNGIYRAFEKTEWRPDYYVVSDLDATYYGKQDILDMNVANKFVADVAWNFGEEKDGLYKWHLVRRWENGRLPEFTTDFSKCSYAGRTITYDGGLQLAAYMGFKDIYLLGIDCCNYSDKGTVHFFDSLGTVRKEETGLLQIDNNLLAYMSAKKYADEHDINIYNATRGGALEIFPRVDFEKLFPDT